MDQMAALSHLRALIKAAKGKNDVEALHHALHEMLLFVEKSLGRRVRLGTTDQPPRERWHTSARLAATRRLACQPS